MDEKSLRREGWTEGAKVTLGDGQEWTFPRPWLTLFPGRDEAGKLSLYGRTSFGHSFIERLDEFVDSEPEDAFLRMSIIIELATTLLLQNYDLTDRQLAKLLPLEVGGPSTDNTLWDAVREVIFGGGPKALPGGSDSPSSPTESETLSLSTTQ